MIPALLDRQHYVRCARGETIRLTVQVRRRDGSIADLTGLQFAWRVFNAKGDTLAEVLETGNGDAVTFALGGDVTEALLHVGMQHRVEQLLEDGGHPLVEGQFVARAGPERLPGVGLPGGVLAMVDEARGQVLIDTRGAPGLTPWEAAGQTLAAWRAALAESARTTFVQPDEPDALGAWLWIKPMGDGTFDLIVEDGQ